MSCWFSCWRIVLQMMSSSPWEQPTIAMRIGLLSSDIYGTTRRREFLLLEEELFLNRYPRFCGELRPQHTDSHSPLFLAKIFFFSLPIAFCQAIRQTAEKCDIQPIPHPMSAIYRSLCRVGDKVGQFLWSLNFVRHFQIVYPILPSFAKPGILSAF